MKTKLNTQKNLNKGKSSKNTCQKKNSKWFLKTCKDIGVGPQITWFLLFTETQNGIDSQTIHYGHSLWGKSRVNANPCSNNNDEKQRFYFYQ